MSINCIAVIGKQNNPLFIKAFNSDNNADLKFHYIAHTSCDVIEERVLSNPKNLDMYLGLLYTLEDFAIYGYLTNTKVKFIIVLTIGDTPIRESEIRTTFRRIHNEYMNLVMNPFFNSDSSSMIKSKKFIKAIDSIVAT